jgi:putative ABC transport system permease protein
VLRLIVGQGMSVVAGGVAIGLLAALLATRWMASLLFGIGAADALAFLGAGALLASVALVACLLPARRAVGTSPATVLRAE